MSEVDDAEVRGVRRIDEHGAVADAAHLSVRVSRHEQEVAHVRARRLGRERVVAEECLDRLLALHLSMRTEAVPEDLIRRVEVRVGRILDGPDLVFAGFALDHLHHVLVEEILHAEPDTSLQAGLPGFMVPEAHSSDR